MIKYYPKSQIKTNQTSKSGEFIPVVETPPQSILNYIKDGFYVGPFFSTSDNKFYTGNAPSVNPKENIELISVGGISNNPLVKSNSTESKVDNILEQEQIKSYYSFENEYSTLVKKGYYSDAPLPPSYYKATYNEEDWNKGYIFRFFAILKTSPKITEISEDTFNKFINRDKSVQWELYKVSKVKWVINSPTLNAWDSNKFNVSEAENRGLKGLSQYLQGNYTETLISV